MPNYGASVNNRVHLMRPEMYNLTLCGLQLSPLALNSHGRDLIQVSHLDPHMLPKYVICRSCLQIDKKRKYND